jgi:hypothetical protein
MVLHAPGYWQPFPARQYPGFKYYFQVPEEREGAAVFFEGGARLFAPDGTPYRSGKTLRGWVSLENAEPGLWCFQPVRNRLVRVRNIPPFFAVRDPEAFFLPEIAWDREETTEEQPLSRKEVYVDGAIDRPGDKALNLSGGRSFRLDAGEANRFLPFEQGTIELWLKPSWSTFSLPDECRRYLIRVEADGTSWGMSYRKDMNATKWLDSHTLFGHFRRVGEGGKPTTLRIYRRTVFEQNKWIHLAWVWGQHELGSSTEAKRMSTVAMRVFIDGKPGYYNHGHL